MVAEVSQAPQKPSKRARQVLPWRFPESTRLSIRSLYVVHGRQPKDIALALNLKAQQVSNIIHREGWTALRPKKPTQRQEKLEIAIREREQADVARVVEATALLSEDLSLRSLNYCSELLDAKDPKGLQMASGAARNFVQIARMSRGLDSKRDTGADQSAQLNVNLFLVRGETLEQPIKRAEAVDVVAKAVAS